MSGAQMETNINISPLTLERAQGAKEAIEKFYVDMINIKQERNERFRKIDQLLTQASFSEEEKNKVGTQYKTFLFLIKFQSNVDFTCTEMKNGQFYTGIFIEKAALCYKRIRVLTDEKMQVDSHRFYSIKSHRERRIRRSEIGSEGRYWSCVCHEGP